MSDQVATDKERRVSFARGYADAWAKRDRADDRVFEYEKGYDEGRVDRTRADSPKRKTPRR